MFAAIARRCRPILGRLAMDRRGAVAVTAALAATVLIGFAGIAVDIAVWETNKRDMQGAADQAAYSAAVTAAAGGSMQSSITAGRGVAANMGYVHGKGGVTVDVHNPPTQGSQTTNQKAWEAIIRKPQQMWFANLFQNSRPTAAARAVAITGLTDTYCMLILAQGSGTLSLSGSPQINAPSCNMQVNSTDAAAVTLGGSASITANALSIVGNPGYSVGGSGSINAKIVSNANSIQDPYASLTIPPSSTWPGIGQNGQCQPVSIGSHQTVTLTPGCYTGSISVGSGSTLILTAGTYYFDQAAISASGGGTITFTGVGVTLVLTSSTGSNYSSINLSSNSVVTLTAQPTGPFPGIVVYADRNIPNSTAMSLGGGSLQTFTGVLYFPSTMLNFGGNANATACTEIIAYKVSLGGNSTFGSTCGLVGASNIIGNNTYVAE